MYPQGAKTKEEILTLLQKKGELRDKSPKQDRHRALKIPVIGVGRLDHPELAARALTEGKADMTAIGRGLLADPLWAAKVRTATVDDIRPCIACYDACFGNYNRMRPICCVVNPSSGREPLWAIVDSRKTLCKPCGMPMKSAVRSNNFY